MIRLEVMWSNGRIMRGVFGPGVYEYERTGWGTGYSPGTGRAYGYADVLAGPHVSHNSGYWVHYPGQWMSNYMTYKPLTVERRLYCTALRVLSEPV